MIDRKEKFTPGPWIADEDGLVDKIVVSRDYDLIIDITHKNGKRNDADAYLISAAPEMYAELKYLLDAMENGAFPQVAPGVDYPAIPVKIWELQKLLKKVRGEE